eukprot:SAG22_NODE_1821_length_3512_cov_3.979197_1_plen_729_part_10
MKVFATLLATLGCVAAVPMQGMRSMDVSATVSSAYAASADTSVLRASLEATYVNSKVDVSFGEARRQLQDGAVNLRISYVVACTSDCDAVASSLQDLSSDPALGAAHASLVIAAVNDAAAAAGFSDAVVLSTASEVASTLTQPEQVTITLPGGGDVGGMLTNGNLEGPVSDNAIPGWTTTAATLSIVDQDGRTGVLSVADAGSFSAVSQTLTLTPGSMYFISFDVWATPLGNTAGQVYCSSTDSNGLLDIHAGTDAVARHGEMRICPLENAPGTWQTAEAIYTAEEAQTTFALHSESGWTAFFDTITIQELAPEDMPAWNYLGCFVDSANRDLEGPASSVPQVPVDAANACAVNCAGWQYFGLQWVNECFCGNTYGGQGAREVGDCDADGVITDGVADKCSNGEGNCGWANAVYSVTAPVASTIYAFSGSADDTSGDNHGTITGATLTADRFGVDGEAYLFDGNDVITVPTPFAAGNEAFSIALWLSPSLVNDGSWHGFCGYQAGGTRSPSLWVNWNGGGGVDAPEDFGMHWDTRTTQGGDSTRFAGVINSWFTADMYVHTVWTAAPAGDNIFYKNGAVTEDGTVAAAAHVDLHDSYTIGKVDNWFLGTIDEVSMYNVALAPGDVALMYAAGAVYSTVATYLFAGNADDTTGTAHGAVTGATLTNDRFGAANQAYAFDGDDVITVSTPFTSGDEDFSIALWLSPSIVNDGSWHGFCGYQAGGTRSPSLW